MLGIVPHIELEFSVLSFLHLREEWLFTLPQYTVGSNTISHSLFLHSDQTHLP